MLERHAVEVVGIAVSTLAFAAESIVHFGRGSCQRLERHAVEVVGIAVSTLAFVAESIVHFGRGFLSEA